MVVDNDDFDDDDELKRRTEWVPSAGGFASAAPRLSTHSEGPS